MKRTVVNVILIVYILISFTNNVYGQDYHKLFLNAYNTLSIDQKIIMSNNIKKNIDEHWSDCIKKVYNKEKRIEELLNSQYENEKIITNTFNYKLGKTSTPSSIAAFISIFDSSYNGIMNYEDDNSMEENEYEKKFYDNFYEIINNVLNNSSWLDTNVKSFIMHCDQSNKKISKVVDGDNVYINIEYDKTTEYWNGDLVEKYGKKVIGLDVTGRGDITYNFAYSFGNEELIKLLLKEGIF